MLTWDQALQWEKRRVRRMGRHAFDATKLPSTN